MLKSVDSLAIVAGLSCCGKTVFLKHIADRRIPDIANAIGLEDMPSWRLVTSGAVELLVDEHIGKLIVHYAFPAFALVTGELSTIRADRRLEIIERAKKLRIITLVAPSQTLRDRLRERQRKNWKLAPVSPLNFFNGVQRMKQLESIYRTPGQLRDVYQRWFAYCEVLPVDSHWLVVTENPYELRPASEWRSVIAKLL